MKSATGVGTDSDATALLLPPVFSDLEVRLNTAEDRANLRVTPEMLGVERMPEKEEDMKVTEGGKTRYIQAKKIGSPEKQTKINVRSVLSCLSSYVDSVTIYGSALS